MSLKLGLYLGYWGIGPAGEDAADSVRVAEEAGFESVWVAESYGSDVISVLAWLGRADQDDQARRGDHAGSRPSPCRRGDGGRDDRQTLRRALPLRLRALAARRSPRAGTGCPTRSPGGEPASTSKWSARSSPARDHCDTRATHYALPLPGGEGKALKLNFHPERNRIPVFLGAIGRKSVEIAAEIADGWIPIFFSVDAFQQTWGEHIEAGLRQGRAASALTSRSRPRCRSRSTATWRRRRAWSRPASSFTSAVWAVVRPTSTSTSPTASASARSPTRCSAASRTATAAGAFEAMPDEIVEATSLVGSEAEVAERIERFRRAGIDRLIVSPVHLERDQQRHTIERLAALASREPASA